MAGFEPLLEHAEWLGRLARRLVGSDAEDVVQDTWIAALRSPPDPARAPRPWLAKVMLNTVRARWRSRARREAREELVASQPRERRPDEAVQQLDQLRVLCDAIQALPVDARELIVQHYFEHQQLDEIARRRGVPAGTVRWQHRRALELLRERLDAAHRGDRRRWIAALLPIASPTRHANPVLAGVLAMKKTLLLAAILVAIAGVWWAASGSRAPRGKREQTAVTTVATPHGAANSPRSNEHTRAAISGTIRDAKNAPIHDANVCASEGAAMGAFPRCTMSSADGAYRLVDLPAGNYVISASARGYAPAAWRRDADAKSRVALRTNERRDGVDLTLVAGGVEVRGRVADVGGGTVGGAEVMLSTETSDERMAPVAVRTRDDGTFAAWVMPGVVVAVGRIDGYTEGHAIGRAPTSSLDISLTPESRLEGIVIDERTKSPIANAEVSVGGDFGVGFAGFTIPLAKRVHTTTDQAGRFVLAGLSPGRYKPSAQLDGFVGTASRSVVLGLAQIVGELEIDARRAPLVTAHLGGRSCDQWSATLTDATANPAALNASSYRMHSTEPTLTFAGVAPGRYTVIVGCDGIEDRHNADVDVRDRDVNVDWKVAATGQTVTVRGDTRDRYGKPVAGVRVVASTADVNELASRSTLDDGSFAFVLPAGRFTIAALDNGEPPQRKEIVITDRPPAPIAFVVGRSTHLTGAVRDRAGLPVVGLIVHLRADSQTPDRTNREAPTGDDGTFDIAGVAAGDYTIFATSSLMGWQPPHAQPLALHGEPTHDVVVEVDRAVGKITGVVRDSNGAPISDAYVVAASERDGAAPMHAADRDSALTDPSGGFAIERLEPGPYTILAMHRGGGGARVKHVEVGARVDVRIAATGSLHGTVVTGSGAPAEHFEVRANDADQDFGVMETFANGAFAIDGVPATAIHVVVSGPDGDGEAEVAVAAGVDASVHIALAARPHVIGRVIDAATKRPLAGVELAVVRIDGDSPLMGEPGAPVTDAGGKFDIRDAPIGATRVFVDPPRGWRSERFERAIPAGTTFDLGDIELTAEP